MRLPIGCVVMVLVACGPAVAIGEEGGDDSSGDTTGGSTSSSTTIGSTVSVTIGTTTVPPNPTTTATTTSATSGPVTMTTDPSATVSTTDPTGTGYPNGSMCEFSTDCESGHCYVAGILSGICGECEVDADCGGGGCSIPNPIAMPPLGSVCNDGSYGSGCMSTEVCQDGLECATVLDIPGVLSASTCSECTSDAECDPGFLCAPDIAVQSLTGVYRCVAAGTLANGQSCEFAGSGDESCVSGHCAIADVMGLVQIGVCSVCEIDQECQPGQVCEAPQVDLTSGLIAGTCV